MQVTTCKLIVMRIKRNGLKNLKKYLKLYNIAS